MNASPQIRTSPRVRLISNLAAKWFIGGSIVVAVLLLISTDAFGDDPVTYDWWFSAPSDASWDKKSFDEIRASAEQGDAAGQYYLGRAYFLGQGGKRDLTESFRWIRRAAEQGYSQAVFALGRCYYKGVGTTPDSDQGFLWISRAAEKGNPDAMAVLGRIYEYGDGAPRDAVKALEWFRRGVAAGSATGSYWLGEFYLNGEAGSAKRINYVEALRAYERAASNGLVLAAIRAADLCASGHGTPPDLQRALFWVRSAADRFSPDAFERLQGFYASGLAEPRNLDENPTWLRRQAAVRRAVVFNQNGTTAFDLTSSWALVEDCEDLWNRYRFGIGTAPDYVATAEWMWQAFQVDLAFVATGQGSLSGGNRAIDPFDAILSNSATPSTPDERLWRQAVRLVHDALDLRRPEASHRVGESYRDGSALSPKQPFFAWAWFARAAELGHAPAKDAIKALESTFTAAELATAKLFWVPPVRKDAPANQP